ncbi:hypothetical protein Ancab_001872 [Ancistrocladus abbreviatus]
MDHGWIFGPWMSTGQGTINAQLVEIDSPYLVPVPAPLSTLTFPQTMAFHGNFTAESSWLNDFLNGKRYDDNYYAVVEWDVGSRKPLSGHHIESFSPKAQLTPIDFCAELPFQLRLFQKFCRVLHLIPNSQSLHNHASIGLKVNYITSQHPRSLMSDCPCMGWELTLRLVGIRQGFGDLGYRESLAPAFSCGHRSVLGYQHPVC